MAKQNYKCLRFRYVRSFEDMQKIIKEASQYTTIIYRKQAYTWTPGLPDTKIMSVVNDTSRYYKFTTRYIRDVEQEDGSVKYVSTLGEEKYVCTWIFDKTGQDVYRIHPSRVAKSSNKVYKPYNIIKEQPGLFEKDAKSTKDKDYYIQSASPIIGYNEKYDNSEHQVVCYDLNSAYAAKLIDKIIDTYNCRMFDTVKDNEVGFMFNSNLELRYKGQYAEYIFPLIDSPFKDYATKLYNQKQNSPKGSRERDEAKQRLVITVGLWQNVNPFLRAYIVNSCNQFIDNFVKKYYDKVCMWNTDAIYATEHIPELDALCGDGIGQFKVEYEGLFRQKGCNYQKVEESKTSYRKIINILFPQDYNILTDELPEISLPYQINPVTHLLEKNKEFNNGKSL